MTPWPTAHLRAGRTTDLAAIAEMLRSAALAELALIPPYLYALYTLADQQGRAAGLLRSVVVEEMLHHALARNVLAAVGDDRPLYPEAAALRWPMVLRGERLPILLDLGPADGRRMAVFADIERSGAVETTPGAPHPTLASVYAGVIDGLSAIDQRFPGVAFAHAQPGRHLVEGWSTLPGTSWDSGHLVAVADLAAARRALGFVVAQGSGLPWAPHTADTVGLADAHWVRFGELGRELGPADVIPVGWRPRAELAGDTRLVADLFDAAWAVTLATLDELYGVEARAELDTEVRRPALVDRALHPLMRGVLRPVARQLVALGAGPCFEPDGVAAEGTLEALERAIAAAGALVPPGVAEIVARIPAIGIERPAPPAWRRG